MKRFLFLFTALCFFSMVSAQTKSTPGSSGAASSSSGSSTAPQTGFVYYLKYQRHLSYASTESDIFYFTYNDLSKNSIHNVFNTKIENDKLIQATITLNRKSSHTMTTGQIGLADYEITQFDSSVSCTQTPACKYQPSGLDTVLIVKIMFNDSIPRYWARSTRWIFPRHRLRISINPDSALLSARIYYVHFDDGAQLNQFNVTNPNYRGRGQQSTGAQARMRAPSINEKDVDFQNSIKDYQQTAAINKKTAYQKAVTIYQDIVNDYTKYIEAITAKNRVKNTKKLEKQIKKRADQEYGIVVTDYDLLVKTYNDLVSETKQELDNQLAHLHVPDAGQSIKNQVGYFESLLALYKSNAKIPTPVINTYDETIPEQALPINELDSANNFYFKIIHKNLVRQKVYYLPLHYGTWDYGTLTVPYRYRFAQPNARIITQAGIASSALPGPSESDAALSLAVYVGKKWGRTKFYEDPMMTHNTFSFEVAAITGPTLIPLMLSNVDSSSKYVGGKSNYFYTGPTNIISWSLGLGAVLEWKTINFGAFIGTDFPLTPHTGWIYANKIWLGFGIGVNLGMFASGTSVN